MISLSNIYISLQYLLVDWGDLLFIFYFIKFAVCFKTFPAVRLLKMFHLASFTSLNCPILVIDSDVVIKI